MAGFYGHRQYEFPRECKAFSAFKEVLVSIREKYKELNPKTGLVCGTDTDGPLASSNGPPSETVMEFLRGGIISTMAAWEAYVHDLLEEAFERVLELGQGDLAELKKKWPGCETLIQNAFKKRYKGESGNKKLPAEKVAFDLMVDYEINPWEVLLNEERDHALRQLQPIFWGPNGIDSTFAKIFSLKKNEKSLSQRVVSLQGYPFQYYFRHSPGQNGVVDVIIEDNTTLNDILRLYYGVRCAFAHGRQERTTDRGVLKDFPTKLDTLPAEAEKRLLELYERIRDHGRASYIAYPILVNMNRFILNVAWFLFTVIAEWFYDKFKIRMWNYDPTQQKSWRRENPDDDAV
jgi:hypothetical protein